MGKGMVLLMEKTDILNSKIKKLRIELPHYSFSHSSSGDSSHDFIGRKRIKEKLKKVIEDSPEEPGVYLVAGNRGVGKTSLVNEVIKETSLEGKSSFSENLRYLILLFLAVVGTQFCSQQFSGFFENIWIIRVIWFMLFTLSFIILCCSNIYRRKFPKQNKCLKICNSITSAIKELSYLINPKKTQNLLKIVLIVSFTQICSHFSDITPIQAFGFYLCFVFMFCRFLRNRLREYCQKYKNYKSSEKTFGKILKIFCDSILNPFKNYIKNHNRLYLRINFGHKLKDEKDILRLIARTLSTEYNRYRYSFSRMLSWRIIAFGFLFLFAYLFNTIIKDIELKKDWEDLEVVFSQADNKVEIKVETKADTTVETKIETKTDTKIGAKVNNLLLTLNNLVLRVANIPQHLWDNGLKFNEIKIKNIISQVNNFFWLSFFSMYLFCILLFRCNLITHFFVTHRIIMRRLKKLNNDITHSTERENSIGIAGYNSGVIGPGIITKTKKSRNVADAREIEKELQDILNDMLRIPVIMCRPSIVIVFDELDKVEPGDASLEKESPQTKASMFSVNATRERQTEILRILSNLKYFLSTAKAKFIFIAGREMYDIHLADVSERNNYIGSIFNVVIYVPSFLTDHPTNKAQLPEESSIAVLPEEFVCRRLFPHDYPAESYDLENYQKYLKGIMLYEAARDKKQKEEIKREIEQQIDDIIDYAGKKAAKRIQEISIEQNATIEQIKKSLLEENEEIKRQIKGIKDMLPSAKEEKIEQKIKEVKIEIEERIASEEKNEIKRIQKIFFEQNEKIKQIIIEKNKEIRERIQKLIDDIRHEEIQKVIAVLQQFIIYLAHLSKGAPKKMMQLFESFVEIRNEKSKNDEFLVVQRYHNSRHFLSFNYYKQYTLGIIAYLITPIFYRLAESNIKEHSDKLLVSALRFVDFVFKFHKHPFSYKHLDISPEMLEVNRAPELKSVAVDLLNYLAQVHINKSNFSLSEYRFDGLIANEIFAMAKTDDVFSALFSFSLDELLPLKNHYKNLLKEIEKEYKNDKTPIPTKYIDAISSLQAVLGDLYYYDDGLEEAEAYYKSSVQALHENKGEIKLEQFYVYIRNMLRLGIIYEKRKQYDFAYLTYGELCKRIRQDLENISFCIYDMSFEKTAYDGLKMLYLPFIAKLQILEQSHFGGITLNHLELLNEEFKFIIKNIDNKITKFLEAEFYSRVADILYYKNSDLSDLKCKKEKKCSCAACYYYRKALSVLLKSDENTVKDLLCASIKQINGNYNMKFCTVLARILSDWGNVFFSCDISGLNTKKNEYISEENKCYIYDERDCNTILEDTPNDFLDNCMKYLESEKTNWRDFSSKIKELSTKRDIAFAMYAISLHAYRKANLHKRSAYQIYKMLCLFKHYEIYKCKESNEYIKQLSKKSLNYLWRANENLGVFELNKRKKDFEKETIKNEDKIPLHYLLVDSEITRIRILVKELGLKSGLTPEKLKDYYALRITSPYRINYSIVGRIYRLRLKSIVNYKTYQQLLENSGTGGDMQSEIEFILKKNDCNETAKKIFGKYFGIKKIEILENLIAETIYCLIDTAQLLETMDETYLFPHSFLGSIHKNLSFWIRLYETYEIYIEEKNQEIGKHSQIKEYLRKYLDEEWRETLSGYRENQRALSHYYKSLEMHNEGRAYHNMIDTMCYVKDDYNDRSYHFNIAEERFLILNDKIKDRINEIKGIYKDSELYKIENYFEEILPTSNEETLT